MNNIHETLKPDSLIWENSEEEMVLQTTNSRIWEVLNDEIELSSSSFIIQKIQELNPGVEIKTDVDRSMIFSSLPVEELVLPEWFYFNYKNGITNKHNTQSGRYGSVHVYPIEYYDESLI